MNSLNWLISSEKILASKQQSDGYASNHFDIGGTAANFVAETVETTPEAKPVILFLLFAFIRTGAVLRVAGGPVAAH